MPEDHSDSISNQNKGRVDGNIVQVGTASGDFYFNSGGDPSIEVILTSGEEIRLDPHRQSTLDVGLINRFAKPITVELHVTQLPPEVVTIDPGRIQLPPGEFVRRAIRLHRTSTTPLADTYTVQVVATEADSKHRRWTSNDRAIVVPEKPELTLQLARERIGGAARCETLLTVANRGNVRIEGSLLVANLPPADGVELVFTRGHGFSLGAGEVEQRTVAIRLPRRTPLRRTWHPQIDVGTGRPDLHVKPASLEIRQPGWLHNVSRGRWANVLLPQRSRRVVVAAWAVIALIVGLLAGEKLAPTRQTPLVTADRPVATTPQHVAQSSLPTSVPNILAGRLHCADHFPVDTLWPPPDYFDNGKVDPAYQDPYRTALEFTQDYLGFSAVDSVLGERSTFDRGVSSGIYVSVGYRPPGQGLVTVADVDVVCAKDGLWAVRGTGDDLLVLATPKHDVTLPAAQRNPVTLGGTSKFSGADRMAVSILDPSSTTPISAGCSADDVKNWSTTCSYHDTRHSPLIVMVAVYNTSGQLLKFALTCFR